MGNDLIFSYSSAHFSSLVVAFFIASFCFTCFFLTVAISPKVFSCFFSKHNNHSLCSRCLVSNILFLSKRLSRYLAKAHLCTLGKYRILKKVNSAGGITCHE